MAIATHTHAALTALKDALAAATGVPQSLTEIAAGGGPTLTAPLIYEIRETGAAAIDVLGRTIAQESPSASSGRLPRCVVGIGGDPEQDDWLSAARDNVIPIEVMIESHGSDLPLTADQQAEYYARAIDAAVTRRVRAGIGAGVWNVDVTFTGIRAAGNRRMGTVEGLLYQRTTRE